MGDTLFNEKHGFDVFFDGNSLILFEIVDRFSYYNTFFGQDGFDGRF
jgi:hypothetical protein